jgi:hypothetical protein
MIEYSRTKTLVRTTSSQRTRILSANQFTKDDIIIQAKHLNVLPSMRTNIARHHAAKSTQGTYKNSKPPKTIIITKHDTNQPQTAKAGPLEQYITQ